MSADLEKISRLNRESIKSSSKDEMIKRSFDALNKAKEKIKQEIIRRDKSEDNSVVYTAITTFNKTNE